MEKKKRQFHVTIKDVAREAGVSVATVSAVINKSRYVSDELADKVLKKLNIPLVIVHSPRDIDDVDRILVDDVKGAFEATYNLIKRGHKRILSLGVVLSFLPIFIAFLFLCKWFIKSITLTGMKS